MKKSGIALLGIGYYATEQLAPAFRETQHCYLAAVITGERSKGDHFIREYGLSPQQIYTYDQFDQLKNDPSIELVYSTPASSACRIYHQSPGSRQTCDL